MTKQEAVIHLKAECIGCCHPQAMEYCEHNCEVGIAIECIEKQIPKKPLDARPPMHKDNVRCPNCGNTFTVVEKVSVVRHCHECGQAIDWSDNND